jgi:hypothetical protein
MMQPFAPLIDTAFMGQIAKHALECGTIGVLGAKGACDFANADLAAAFADEGDKFLARGQPAAQCVKIIRQLGSSCVNYVRDAL